MIDEVELNRYLHKLVISLKMTRNDELAKQKILLSLIKETLEIKKLNREFLK